MNILIITQVVDKEHPALGFFHRWIEYFAQHCEKLTVICLYEGAHQFPSNVTVVSLGKESGSSRLSMLWRFLVYSWKLRSEYDRVFVHMNQIYVLLGSPIWFVLQKPIALWYTHGTVSLSLRAALQLVHKVYTASKDSFNIASKKVTVTGHGIDTEVFTLNETISKDIDLITVGRISRAKNITTLVELMAELPNTTLTIVGAPIDPSGEVYLQELQALVKAKELTDRITFVGSVANDNLPTLLQRGKIFVTAAQNGSLDKVMLEAMACGLPVVSSAPGSRSLPLGTGQVSDHAAFKAEVQRILATNDFIKTEYTTYIQTHHSLATLIPKLLSH